jgi:AraC-like DNA-binding protein
MHAPLKKRPGRKPFRVTSAQRERVMTCVAARMTLPQIAAVVGCSRRTLCEHFTTELATGRARRILEAVELLRKAALKHNVSATKALLVYYGDPQVPPEGAPPRLGKKAQAMLDAQKALADSEWGDDLRPPPGVRFETELPDADEQSSLDDEAARTADLGRDWGDDLLVPTAKNARFRKFEK